jgi:hypothetical protein
VNHAWQVTKLLQVADLPLKPEDLEAAAVCGLGIAARPRVRDP